MRDYLFCYPARFLCGAAVMWVFSGTRCMWNTNEDKTEKNICSSSEEVDERGQTIVPLEHEVLTNQSVTLYGLPISQLYDTVGRWKLHFTFACSHDDACCQGDCYNPGYGPFLWDAPCDWPSCREGGGSTVGRNRIGWLVRRVPPPPSPSQHTDIQQRALIQSGRHHSHI